MKLQIIILATIIASYLTINVIFTFIVTAVTLQNMAYISFNLKDFFNEIKECFLDDSVYNIPFPISYFKKMTFVGKSIFILLWAWFIPAYCIGITFAFILWVLRLIFIRVCYKK